MSQQTYLAPTLLTLLLFGTTSTSMAGDGERTLFDFSKPDAAQAWQPVNDGVMGGVSDGRFKITDQGTMEFFGTLSLENNGGFASVRSRRSDLGLKPDDTLLIRLRGDGREYLLNLYVPSLQIAYSYRAAIPTKAGEWTEVRIPLKDCYATSFGQKVPNAGPVDAPKVNSIGFMLSDKKAGPFKLEIAWVKVASQRPHAEAGLGGDQGKSQRADKEIGPDQMMGLMKEARTLTDVRVEELRTRLNGDPKDLDARLLLIFHAMSSRTDRSSPAEVGSPLGTDTEASDESLEFRTAQDVGQRSTIRRGGEDVVGGGQGPRERCDCARQRRGLPDRSDPEHDLPGPGRGAPEESPVVGAESSTLGAGPRLPLRDGHGAIRSQP